MNRTLSSKLALAAALPLVFGVVACDTGDTEPADDVNGEFEDEGVEDDGLDDGLDDGVEDDGLDDGVEDDGATEDDGL